MSKANTQQKITKVKHYFLEDLWLKDMTVLPWFKRFGLTTLKVLFTAFKGYKNDNCGLQASALTYITLVSLVPMLAIMFSFSKSMGLQKRLYDSIGVERVVLVEKNAAAGIQEVIDYKVRTADESSKVKPGLMAELPESMQGIVLQIFRYVENTNFAAMGIVGSMMLFISVVLSIAKLEKCFNVIWGIDVPRSLFKKFTEYLVVLIVAPVLFMLVTSVNTMLMSEHVMNLLTQYAGPLASMMAWIAKLATLCVLFLFFAFFFMFMPHTKVKATAALISGVSTGILWLIVLLAYMKLQIGLAKFNSIYGTFAALPFFLAVLYAHWSIIMLGGEISYAVQYHRFMRIEKMEEPMPAGACMILGQLAMYEACKAYANEEGSWCPEQFGIRNAIPVGQLQYVMMVLMRAKLMVQINSKDDHDHFVPGCPPSAITMATVEQAFRDVQSTDYKVFLDMMPAPVKALFSERFQGFVSSLNEKNFETLIAEDK